MTSTIKGYRELNQDEIDLVNRITDHAEQTRRLVYDVQQHIVANASPEPYTSVTSPPRWASIGQTELQLGFMALTRAVAQPTTF